MRAVVADRRARTRGVAGEKGQALVIALIVVFLFGLLPTITFVTLRSVQPAVNNSVKFNAALAAAQAGLQEYRNLLNQYSDYSNYSGTNEPPASEGGCNPAFTGSNTASCHTAWVPVSSAKAPISESFEYTPNRTQLNQTASGATLAGQLVVTVIGRAGTGSGAVYRRIDASLELSGAIQDLYFSTFEQPGPSDYDQWQNTYSCGYYNCSLATGSHLYDESQVTVAVTVPGAALADPNIGQPYAQALCQYDAWQPNTFIDWYSQYVQNLYPPNGAYPSQSTPYSSTHPYYGPWYGTFPDPQGNNLQFGSNGNGGSIGGACPVNFWVTGDKFNGPVYSHDELTTCGSPSFTSLSTATPQYFDFPKNWPGTFNSGGYGRPYGWVQDPFGTCYGSGSDSPSVGSVQFGQNQSLPPIANQIGTEIQDNQLLGCVYTGPTAIHFYYNSSNQQETMSVWSPLTRDPYASTYGGTTAQCGQVATSGPKDLCGGPACTYNTSTGLPTNTQISTGKTPTVQSSASYFAKVPVVPGEVIWVQNAPIGAATSSTDPNYWTTTTGQANSLPAAESNAPSSGCIDPWTTPDEALGNNTCTEGDVMIGGVTHGGLTIGSANDIVLSRSLAYSCALTSSTAFSTSVGSNCASSNDTTGLIADNSVWMSDSSNASSTCADTNTNNPSWAVMMPASVSGCYIKNPVIDAAVAALKGFFEVQNWRYAPAGGTLHLNGSQEVLTAGQYGIFQTNPIYVYNGYYLQLSYDHRLMYSPPPGYIQAIGAVWDVNSWISCGSSPSPAVSPGGCSTLKS